MFADRMRCEALTALPAGSAACVAGRIVAQSEQGALLRDDSGIARLSVVAPLALNAIALARGVWDGHSLLVASFDVLQRAHGETSELTELARNDNAKHRRLIARAEVLRNVRAFFDRQGFLEVETPLVVPSPGLDVHLDALTVGTDVGERYLITSPEYQLKRLLAGGLERIYALAKCFRNDELGQRHQPEFTMLEWYRAYAGVEDVMSDTEQLVAAIAISISGEPVLHTAHGAIDVSPPWPRITVREAFARFAQVDVFVLLDEEQGEDAFYRLLIERVEPALRELGALFLCEYPASMASLARKKPEDPRVAERFEAYVAGVELCNGFGELTDPIEQRARLLADQAERARQAKPVYPIDERFLAALEQGLPPSAGNALGLDRLLMLALGAANIEDVMALPASRL
jgi:lysyl-tRNA synthetase class 2